MGMPADPDRDLDDQGQSPAGRPAQAPEDARVRPALNPDVASRADLFPPTQMVVDPDSGRDITGEYVRERLEILEVQGEEIVATCAWLARRHPEWTETLRTDGERRLHEVIGTGSIGPATAAAGPLLERLKRALREALSRE